MKKFWITSACAALVLAGCAEDAPDDQLPGNDNDTGPAATLTVEGNYSVLVGGTLNLTVTTENGTDSSYTYESANGGIASAAEGVVTGLSAGETVITVTGDDTGATAMHPVVVQEEPIDDEVPFLSLWQSSAHSDSGSGAFTHWDEDGEIPARCAKCHSEGGFRDYLGDDGSAVRSVDGPAELGTVVNCNTCHNPAALEWDTVTFPTDTDANPDPATVTGLGREAVCMECHQGRSSTPRVNEDIAEAMVSGPDEISEDLGIVNPHYYPAAATLFAGEVMGGYQYDPVPESEPTGGDEINAYDSRFRHVPGVDTCTDCHDAHSTQIKFNVCTNCHAGATDLEGLRNLRMSTSSQDYDGDGNVEEGIYFEIQTLRETLFDALLLYADRTLGQPICYNNQRYPYFFEDDDRDGDCPDGAERYSSWSPRLVRGAYNYLLATTERGAFAHNAKYVIQLLVDSTRDLNEGITPASDRIPEDFARTDVGHFNGASDAARHWDDNDQEVVTEQSVSSRCSACHAGSEGFRTFIETGGAQTVSTANGLDCFTCHDAFGTQPEDYVLYMVDSTTWPDGSMSMLDGMDNLCANCHSGRASKATYDEAFMQGDYGFSNVHYNVAAGQLYGAEEKIGYEYASEIYAGQFTHAGISTAPQRCTACHDAGASNHTFRISDVFDPVCTNCHTNESSAEQIIPIGRQGADHDGDGVAINDDVGGGVLHTPADELADLAAVVLGGLGDAGICYGNAYPYFFNANDPGSADGACAPADVGYGNRVQDWGTTDAERELHLTAAHNFNLYANSPGGYAHNFDYVGQLLWDSACRLGVLPPALPVGARPGTAAADCTP